MSRLRQDKRRLALENYPLRFETRPLYGDVDTNRHVNNVTVARWFEESRAQLNHRVAGAVRLLDPPPGVQLLLVSIHIEYLQQVPYPSTVTVAAAVVRLGGASYGIAHALFEDGRCAALGESVVVQARDGRPLRLTPEERAALEPLAAFDVPEAAGTAETGTPADAPAGTASGTRAAVAGSPTGGGASAAAEEATDTATGQTAAVGTAAGTGAGAATEEAIG